MEETHQGHNPQKEERAVEKALHAPHHTSPSLLVIGTETAVFDPASPVRERILSYARRFGETHIIVLCRGRYVRQTVGNTTFHPTNSWMRLLYGFDALRIDARLPKPMVISVQDPHDSGFLGLVLARMRGTRFHVQVHSDVFADSFKYLSILNRIRAIVARIVLQSADGIRVVSEPIKRSIEARITPRREIAVLPIFVDVQRFAHATPGALTEKFAAFTHRLLWVGRFEPEKRPARALEALAEGAPASACLVMLGKGTLEGALREYAQKLGIEHRVFFEGVHDPAPYYALADLVLLTSAYEGYGRVIVEALASGTPVLSTDVGVADYSGALVANGDFVEALKQWFVSGPRTAHLERYPYRDFDDYVVKYCADIVRSIDA